MVIKEDRNKMKKLCIFLFVITTILGGCSSNIFSGESANWEGKYSTTINGNDEEGNYTFVYKNGNDLTKLKNVEIVVSNGVSGSTKKMDEHEGTTIKLSTSCRGCAVTQENEKIEVTIKWDGKHEESFFLE